MHSVHPGSFCISWAKFSVSTLKTSWQLLLFNEFYMWWTTMRCPDLECQMLRVSCTCVHGECDLIRSVNSVPNQLRGNVGMITLDVHFTQQTIWYFPFFFPSNVWNFYRLKFPWPQSQVHCVWSSTGGNQVHAEDQVQLQVVKTWRLIRHCFIGLIQSYVITCSWKHSTAFFSFSSFYFITLAFIIEWFPYFQSQRLDVSACFSFLFYPLCFFHCALCMWSFSSSIIGQSS